MEPLLFILQLLIGAGCEFQDPPKEPVPCVPVLLAELFIKDGTGIVLNCVVEPGKDEPPGLKEFPKGRFVWFPVIDPKEFPSGLAVEDPKDPPRDVLGWEPKDGFIGLLLKAPGPDEPEKALRKGPFVPRDGSAGFCPKRFPGVPNETGEGCGAPKLGIGPESGIKDVGFPVAFWPIRSFSSFSFFGVCWK